MKVAPLNREMNPDRRRTVLFLLCAVVLLAAGFVCGYIYSFDGFYSPEAQLDRELVEMNFNIRQLYYTNQGQRDDCRRELVKQLEGQVVFVTKLLASCPQTPTRASAMTDLRQAQNVIAGQPMNAATP